MDHLKVYDHSENEQAELELRMLQGGLPQCLRVLQRRGQFVRIKQAQCLQVEP